MSPLFQATIPDILPDKDEFTQALSLSRLAYDLENLISPSLAALLLTVMSWHGLFGGTILGFFASALLVISITLPSVTGRNDRQESIYKKTTRGLRFYLATPRLRGLLALNIAVSAAGAMVIVNTVILVQSEFGLTPQTTAMAMAFFGGGSMLAALTMPKLLLRFAERQLMLGACWLLIAGLVAAGAITSLSGLLPIWVILGMGYAWVQTPSGRLITQSCHPEDRPELFAAQFSLSHACWMISYPAAGFAGEYLGLSTTFLLFAALALIALIAAYKLWPVEVSVEIAHSHPELPPDHPHLAGGNGHHKHGYVIDDLHVRWPS